MPHYRKRGFTLIELLVVIAIIGILSAVVLASLTTARNKGNDAAIQSDLHAIQTQAIIFSATTNSYGPTSTTVCNVAGSLFTDPTILKAITAAEIANGGGTTGVVCNNTAGAFAISSSLVNGIAGKGFWCVDSTGAAMPEVAGLGANVTACP
jgi:prepilin-type N-terminal cleavage/methylation domain-containing protein